MSFWKYFNDADARAIIAAIVLIGMFVELPIVMLLLFKYTTSEIAVDMIRWIFMLYFGQGSYILGYYFGARNNEKARESEKKLIEAKGVIV